MTTDSFVDFFRAAMAATDRVPYPYQRRLATEAAPGKPLQSCLIQVPTGTGKTAAAILAWLWQRRQNPGTTPRRLVYCLPMRVLVEQTRDNASKWVNNLGLRDEIGIHVLMGGEEADDWDLYPERAAILIGTQDMLLSRALNRGYGMSRYRWPTHFGLLHAECLWVFDEIQLMGSGLATTAQLEGFRTGIEQHGCKTLWMSATLQRDWLHTVNFDPTLLPQFKLEDDDLVRDDVSHIYRAGKRLEPANSCMDDGRLAKEVVTAHEKTGGRTLVVVNTVRRARELQLAVRRELKAADIPLDPILIHSRFRPAERAEQIKKLLTEPDERGMIVVTTQVVEAGVDVSARTLFTELAPWSSLVQRFGRCNRRGLDNDSARAFWIDLPKDRRQHEKARYPYELADLMRSRELLQTYTDVSPVFLEEKGIPQPIQHTQVIRRKDFTELFDTTPDLAGNDIDIDRYVREVEKSDVQVFWRKWSIEGPLPVDESRPRREELCSVPIGEFRDEFLKETSRRALAYRWDYLDCKWVRAETKRVYPGQVYLLHAQTGGYSPDVGWSAKLKELVETIDPPDAAPSPEANDDDRLSEREWQSIARHTDRVYRKLEAILGKLPLPESETLKLAARWHDWGKAHDVFQDAIDDGQTVEWQGGATKRRERPQEFRGSRVVAKAPGKRWKDKKPFDRGFWRAYRRRHFRHELASALAVLQRPHEDLAPLSDDDLNLVAYLIAAHHGKVRLSIRSLPGEKTAPDNRRFARGIWDQDPLPTTDLGGGTTAPAVAISLEPMELGLCGQLPFTGQPSWAERVLRLRDTLGPMRLAYLEAILRAADMRASKDNDLAEEPHV